MFFGGGTPSLHPPKLIRRLLSTFQPSQDAEITLEANPGTVDREQLLAYKAAGINRVFAWNTDFSEEARILLNRGHCVKEASQLLQDVASVRFDSWNADLMFALPNQTLEDFASRS